MTPAVLEFDSSKPLTGFALPGPFASEGLGHFVRFAAKIVKAEASFLLLNCEGSLTATHSFGKPGVSALPSWELVSRCGFTMGGSTRCPVFLHAVADRSLLATVAIQRNDLFLGILVICDSYPGSLSSSQEYVLQVIAFELAELLEGELSKENASASAVSINDLTDPNGKLRLLESIVANVKDSVLITEAEFVDESGPRIQYVNPAFTLTTGYSLDEVVGKSPRILQGPLSGSEERERIKAALQTRTPMEVELLNYRKDGTTYWVELSIAPVCDEKGSYTHWISVQFTLLLNGPQSVEQALEVAQRMQDAIQETVMLATLALQITAGVGLCDVGATYIEADDILRDVYTAMVRAKREGGTQCVIDDESMHESALATLKTKLQLKTAVENHEFELYYQPLIDTRDTSICGMEALIRWNHPVRGLLNPGEFIQLAEESGLIVAIGSWVLHQACSDFRLLQGSSSRDLCLSVNVSSRQLDEVSFLIDLSCALEEGGIPPHLLQLEITESIFLKDAVRIGALFQDIRSLGVKIAFDDFGTGYSSLSYLERYPIDTLKIDQSFVQRMRKGSVNGDIVQMIIRLAHAIGMRVSAEGLENSEQAVSLLEYGCTLAQGYLYSRPLSRNAAAAMLKSGISLREASVVN
jgi:PAS domain S-box-containing protein